MAMIGRRDEPTYYNIVTASGEVLVTVPKSKVTKTHKELEAQRGERLNIQLKDGDHNAH